MQIDLEQAVHALKEGGVIAVPTETVYGLAASMHSHGAIGKIFDLKGRPLSNPLIIHCATSDQIVEFVSELPPQFNELAHAFWPGPMTLVLPIRSRLVPSIVRAHLETAGFRIPRHSMARELLQLTGPLVMPSANLSGRPSSTSRKHVEEDFGTQFPVLDGGLCEKGLESTILGRNDGKWVIYRLGALSAGDFESVLGYCPSVINEMPSEKPLCPGQLFRHYSPKARLILGDSTFIEEATCILGFSERKYPEGKQVLILGSLNDPEEVAGNLYSQLRMLDEKEVAVAWVDTYFPREGLWITIAERLERAASK